MGADIFIFFNHSIFYVHREFEMNQPQCVVMLLALAQQKTSNNFIRTLLKRCKNEKKTHTHIDMEGERRKRESHQMYVNYLQNHIAPHNHSDTHTLTNLTACYIRGKK